MSDGGVRFSLAWLEGGGGRLTSVEKGERYVPPPPTMQTPERNHFTRRAYENRGKPPTAMTVLPAHYRCCVDVVFLSSFHMPPLVNWTPEQIEGSSKKHRPVLLEELLEEGGRKEGEREREMLMQHSDHAPIPPLDVLMLK